MGPNGGGNGAARMAAARLFLSGARVNCVTLQVAEFLPSCFFFQADIASLPFSSPLPLCVGRSWSRRLLNSCATHASRMSPVGSWGQSQGPGEPSPL